MVLLSKNLDKNSQTISFFPDFPDLRKKWGCLHNLDKFDATFFGVPPKQASLMDPQLRFMLEVTYEALIDAGRTIALTLLTLSF